MGSEGPKPTELPRPGTWEPAGLELPGKPTWGAGILCSSFSKGMVLRGEALRDSLSHSKTYSGFSSKLILLGLLQRAGIKLLRWELPTGAAGEWPLLRGRSKGPSITFPGQDWTFPCPVWSWTLQELLGKGLREGPAPARGNQSGAENNRSNTRDTKPASNPTWASKATSLPARLGHGEPPAPGDR